MVAQVAAGALQFPIGATQSFVAVSQFAVQHSALVVHAAPAAPLAAPPRGSPVSAPPSPSLGTSLSLPQPVKTRPTEAEATRITSAAMERFFKTITLPG